MEKVTHIEAFEFHHGDFPEMVGMLGYVTPNNPNVINSYHHWNDYQAIEADLKKAMAAKKADPSITVNAYGHSYGADTLLETLGGFNAQQYAGLIDNATMADPVGRLKKNSTKKALYENVRKIVKGKVIDIDAQQHGDMSDVVAGIGDSYDDLLKNEQGITYLVDKNTSHANFIDMVRDKHPELAGESVQDITFMDRVRKDANKVRGR